MLAAGAGWHIEVTPCPSALSHGESLCRELFLSVSFLTPGYSYTEQNMVLEGGHLGPVLCVPSLPRAAIAIAIMMYVSCQQSPEKEVLHEESQNYGIWFW